MRKSWPMCSDMSMLLELQMLLNASSWGGGYAHKDPREVLRAADPLGTAGASLVMWSSRLAADHLLEDIMISSLANDRPEWRTRRNFCRAPSSS